MTSLADSLTLPCGATLPNRLLKSAMTEGLADARDDATERHVTLYRRWAEGGTGTLVTGNVMVDHRYLERPGNVVIESERGLQALERWAEAGTANGTHLWMQISHPGRQCTRMVASRPVAPSEVQLRIAGLFGRPRALSDDEIEAIIDRYAAVAATAMRAGFTGVQIHGAHGYLVSQFLSPRVNRRADRWGGPLENRARFLLEIVRRVRTAVGPRVPVAVKLNSSDFQKGAFSLEDSCRVVEWLAQEGVDLVEISGGTYEHLRLIGMDDPAKLAEVAERTAAREAYFLRYAEALRGTTAVPIAVTGGFRTRGAMTAALEAGELDVVGLARPLCIDPDLSRKLLGAEVETAPTPEDALTLGPGLLGRRSRNDTLRSLNAQAQTAWFYAQIIALSEGRPPELDLGARAALLRHFRRELALARRRRAR